MKDVLLSIDCDFTYHLEAGTERTDYDYFRYQVVADDQLLKNPKDGGFLKKALMVDPVTCNAKYDLAKVNTDSGTSSKKLRLLSEESRIFKPVNRDLPEDEQYTIKDFATGEEILITNPIEGMVQIRKNIRAEYKAITMLADPEAFATDRAA